MTRRVQIAPGVFRHLVDIVNVYFLGKPGQPWVLVDTGVAGSEIRIILAAEKLYGSDSRPVAILLTHGHGDHSGSSVRLADYWNVPVFAHPMERPFLTGLSDYAPMDPTVGGFAGFISRFVPMARVDLGTRLRDLNSGGATPLAPEWRWIFTPGQSPGHVVFFRDSDRVLIAGDALATLDLSSVTGNLLNRRILCGPPEASTSDWNAAENSVQTLASLHPTVLACGHGYPYLEGDGTDDLLAAFSRKFHAPTHGRYVSDPAESDETGITFLPVNSADPIAPVIAGTALVTVGLLTWLFAQKAKGRSSQRYDTERLPDGGENQ